MGLRIQGISEVAELALELVIPPARVADLQKLLVFEAGGFLPSGSVVYKQDRAAFVLTLTGEAVTHVLDLLAIAMDTRGAETWPERQARELTQLKLQLGGEEPPPYFYSWERHAEAK